jgi:Tfp pilus assembly protein PilO
MSNWNQKKLLATIGGSALVLCLAAVGGVYYAQGLIEEIDAQVAQKKDAVAAAEGKLAKVPALEKDVVILRENLDEYVKILPNTRELNAFLRMLNQFERQSGIQSTGLQPKRRNEVKGERFTPIEYTYEATATLWQCLKFMNLIENYERFVSITDVVHRVRLTLQTYAYNGKVEGKEAQIPEYAALKESLREEIWKNHINTRIDRYEHRGAQGRRDILVDPRERGDAPKDGWSPAEQRALVDRYTAEVVRLREMLVRIRKQDTTLFEQYALEKGLKEGLDKIAAEIETDAGRLTYAPYRLRWAKEIVTPLEELRAQVDSTAKEKAGKVDPYVPLKEMQQLVVDMAADCNSGQLEQAKNRYEVVASRMGVPPGDPRHELAVAAKSWHVKASTAMDFKGLDLRVQGVVVSHGGRSGVLLNGEVYEEGDYISDELLVKTVEEEQVWFVFRGLTLVRTM